MLQVPNINYNPSIWVFSTTHSYKISMYTIMRTSCAVNRSIFRVGTVVNCSVGTVNQSALCASTSEVIQ